MKRPIVYVLESGATSGGVRDIYEQINRLHARGWHVEVYSLDQARPAWFPLNPAIPWWRFKNYDHLFRHLEGRDAVKIATWWKTALPVAEASKPGEGFYFVQDIETSYYLSPMQKEAVLETYDYDLIQFTESKWVNEHLPSAEWVGIGLDTEIYRCLDLKRQMNAILSLSRPQRLKGWSMHTELYRKLYHTKEFTLYSFGTGNVHPPYSRSLPRGMPDEDLVKWYNRVGIFVSTSEHEGFSLTLLEAMACGAIVVTTNANGNMQFCEHEKNCLVVPFGDAQIMIDTCKRVMEDDELMMALQQEGIKTAAQFPWEPVIDRLEALYLG